MALCLESYKKKQENAQGHTNKNTLYKDTHTEFFFKKIRVS